MLYTDTLYGAPSRCNIRGCHLSEELVLLKRGQRMGWRVNRGTARCGGEQKSLAAISRYAWIGHSNLCEVPG